LKFPSEAPDGPEEARERLTTLVRRIRRGERAATAEVRVRVRRILAFRGYGIPREDRFDLEQVVLLQIWQAVGRADFDSGGFWGFVEVVASRRAVDWWRARRPEVDFEPPATVADTSTGPLRAVLDREQRELAQAALERLSPECQELIRLQVGSRLSYGELAERLDRSEGALRVQMHRCIRRASRILREILEEKRGPEV